MLEATAARVLRRLREKGRKKKDAEEPDVCTAVAEALPPCDVQRRALAECARSQEHGDLFLVRDDEARTIVDRTRGVRLTPVACHTLAVALDYLLVRGRGARDFWPVLLMLSPPTLPPPWHRRSKWLRPSRRLPSARRQTQLPTRTWRTRRVSSAPAPWTNSRCRRPFGWILTCTKSSDHYSQLHKRNREPEQGRGMTKPPANDRDTCSSPTCKGGGPRDAHCAA